MAFFLQLQWNFSLKRKKNTKKLRYRTWYIECDDAIKIFLILHP